MSDKRPYSNQVNHYCEKCSAWKIHVRGSKYYTCLTCNTKTPVKMARGLTPRALDVCPECFDTGYRRVSPTILAKCSCKHGQRQ